MHDDDPFARTPTPKQDHPFLTVAAAWFVAAVLAALWIWF